MEKRIHCPAFDRPEIYISERYGSHEQLVGFLDANGIESQITLSRAIQLGLVAIGEIKAMSMTTEEYRHVQRTRRIDDACGHCSVGDNCHAREEATRLSDLYTQGTAKRNGDLSR